MRAQVNLPALAIALLVLTATTGLALTVADQAFAGADRDPDERRIAVALADRIVAAGSPVADRANALNASALAALDRRAFGHAFPVAGDADVRVRVADRTVVERGNPTDGTTIRRVVLVQRRQAVTLDPRLPDNETTLPRRTRRVTVALDPPDGAAVRTVRANDRVVLHDPSGLDGEYTVRVSRFETVTLAFETTGPLPSGAVSLTYYPARTTKAVLEVTVDA